MRPTSPAAWKKGASMNWRVLAVSLVAALSACGCAGNDGRGVGGDQKTADRANARPNIVYIVADDLGYADIGAQQLSKDVITPYIDAIARDGVRFTNGYVSCPVCSPTRAGLMTGRYQQRFGHEFNPGPQAAENFGLPTDQVTLPQALKSAGYKTGMVGKWHLGYGPNMIPTARGFDEFFGFLGGAHPYNVLGQGTNAMMRNDKPITEPIGYLTDAFGKEAVSFIDRHAGSAGGKPPFFLYLAFNAIHTPMEAPPEYLKRFPNVTDPKRQKMLAMLAAMDDAIGRVTDALEQHGVADNTLIVFHADNGGPTQASGSRNSPLRSFKGDVYEGGIRVPFAMKWTGHLPAGDVYDQPVIALDVFPAALAAAGATPPKGVKLDGVNLLPHLKSEARGSGAPHTELFWRSGRDKWAVRQGNFKLVHSGPQGKTELYDLSSDPAEANDLMAQRPEIAKRLQAKFDDWNGQLEEPRWQNARQQRGEQRKATGGERRGRRANKK